MVTTTKQNKIILCYIYHLSLPFPRRCLLRRSSRAVLLKATFISPFSALGGGCVLPVFIVTLLRLLLVLTNGIWVTARVDLS